MNTEIEAYLARKIHWTREDILKLHPRQMIELYNEVVYQEDLERYEWLYYLSVLIAEIRNTVLRKSNRVYKPEDIIQLEKPVRINEKQEKKSESNNLILKSGIRLPSK